MVSNNNNKQSPRSTKLQTKQTKCYNNIMKTQSPDRQQQQQEYNAKRIEIHRIRGNSLIKIEWLLFFFFAFEAQVQIFDNIKKLSTTF
jgi:hypothetical protein